MAGEPDCYSPRVKLTELSAQLDLAFRAVSGLFHVHRDHDPGSSLRANCCIKRVFMINNPFLLKEYTDRQFTMGRDGPDPAKEEHLFHASPRGSVDSILHYGFVSPTRKPYKSGFSILFARRSKMLDERTDCTLDDSKLYPLLVGPPKPLPSVTIGSPVVGSARPASSASVASSSPVVGSTHPHVPTAPAHQCRHYMFLCKVLVGEKAVTEHFSHLTSAPQRPNKRECPYHSCEGVGSTTDQVAIYDTSQAYPLYLIEYDLSHKSQACDKEGVAGLSDAQPRPSDAQPRPSHAQPKPSDAQPRPPSVAQPLDPYQPPLWPMPMSAAVPGVPALENGLGSGWLPYPNPASLALPNAVPRPSFVGPVSPEVVHYLQLLARHSPRYMPY